MMWPTPYSRMSRFTSGEASNPSKPTMKRCPTFRTDSFIGSWTLGAEPLADGVVDALAVRRLARRRERGQRRLHRPADVLRGRGPRLGHRLFHRLLDLGIRGLGRQVGAQHLLLRLFLLHQLRPVGLAELEDRVLALLHE